MKLRDLLNVLPENAYVSVELERDNAGKPIVFDIMPITKLFCNPLALEWTVRQLHYEDPGIGYAYYAITVYVADKLGSTEGTEPPAGNSSS